MSRNYRIMSSLIPISVRQDHLEQLAHVTRPVDAVVELIWNAFDAEATAVSVELHQNALGGIEEIVVADNGTGIFPGHAAALFGNLGESWKKDRRISGTGRPLHGRKGRGRFKAFGLGALAEWQSRARTEQGLVQYTIGGDMGHMDGFHVEEAQPIQEGLSGTRVRITALHRECGSLLGDRGRLALAQVFGPFLAANPTAELWMDGEKIEPRLVQLRSEDSLVSVTSPEGTILSMSLRIVEWDCEAERHIHFCDEGGFVRHSVRPGPSIRAKNCNFTAYLRANEVDALARENRLALDEMDPLVAAMADGARAVLRAFLQSREEGKAAETVSRWKEEGIHPFGAAQESEGLGRELFEQAALQVTRRWAGLGDASAAERKLLLALVACAAQTRPAELATLIEDTLGLDKRGRERLQRLVADQA